MLAVIIVAAGSTALCFFLIKGRSVNGASADIIGDWSVSGGDLVGDMGDMGLKVESVDPGGALHGEWEMKKGLVQLPITGVFSGNHISLEVGLPDFTIRVQGTVSGDTMSAEYAEILSGASQPFFARRITMRRLSAGVRGNAPNSASPPFRSSSPSEGTGSPSQSVPPGASQSSTPIPSPQPPPTVETPPPADETASNAASVEGIHLLLNRWTESLRHHDLDEQMNCYAPRLEQYFKKIDVNQDVVRADKQLALARFSVLQVDLTDIQITAQTLDRDIVVFKKTWDFQRASGKPFVGQDEEQLVVTKSPTGWLIVSELEVQN